MTNKIKEFRTRLGLTQEQVANSLGTTQQSVARWERGRSEIPIAQLKDLAVILHRSVDEILSFAPAKKKRTRGDEDAPDPDDVPYGTLDLTLTVGESAYPISERARVSLLRQLADLDPQHQKQSSHWLYCWTLDNKILFANATAVKQVELIGDDVEAMPDWKHLEVYRALQDWDDPRNKIGEHIRSECQAIIKEIGEENATRSVTHARIVFLDGVESWHHLLEEEDALGYFIMEMEISGVAPSSFIQVESEGYYRTRYVSLAQVALIEVPAECYRRLTAEPEITQPETAAHSGKRR